jgi:peroxiredoxin
MKNFFAFSILFAALSAVAPAAEQPAENAADAADRQPTQVRAEDVPEGHSYHGDAFDQGPRQAAYLMAGMGNISFPVVTRDPQVQKFFDQGVAQLHGFWYYEAERSFRQAAALDPDCVMAYWGMAMANVNNAKRAEKFIAEAVKRYDASPERERMWVDALANFYKADPKKDKERRQALIDALEGIVHEYPDDVEAKAFLILQIYLNRGPIPIGSRQAVDALIDQVLAVNPMHPVHHYRIHLWDDGKALQALGSAALCGQATPGIAHMWHMPGHTFSKLERYADAAWQQEAASRVDHAYMMRDYVLPDQIHNYAHNHEWLIRDLSHIGRVRYGLELAKNLTEMPRHPKYNTPAKKGSAQYGRTRLIELLQRYELWGDVIALSDTPYLEATDVPHEQVKRLRMIGAAHYELGDLTAAREVRGQIEKLLAQEKQKQREAGEKAAAAARKKQPAAAKPGATTKSASAPTAAKPTAPSAGKPAASAPSDAAEKAVAKAKQDAENPFRAQIAALDAALADLQAREALHEKKFDEALKQFKAAGITSGEYLSRVQLAAGNKPEAERLARDAVKKGTHQVVPLANLAYILAHADKRDEAVEKFSELRTLAGVADMNVPVFERLAPLAAELGWPADWRLAPEIASDVGVRPALDALGPIRWTPSSAPTFTLTTHEGRSVSLADYRGKNVVLLFYLGFGCLHCTEQLKAFAAKIDEFRAAGLEVVAVSTDSLAALKRAESDLTASEKYPFPILSNSELDVFKKYRAYDDFEKQALHATVFVDASGKIRWYDGGSEPFMDAKFLLTETARLLSLTKPLPEATAGPYKE